MHSGKQGAKTLGRHYFSWWWRGKCPDCMYRYDTYQRADVSNATKKGYDLHANVIFLLAKSVYDITIVSYL